MFENYYDSKLKFDWNKMEVSIKRNDEYKLLNLEEFKSIELEKRYTNWKSTLDYLAMEYKSCQGPKFRDCPIDDSKSFKGISLYSKHHLRIEINLFIFIGIYFGYINIDWDNSFFYKTKQMILFKGWFIQGYYKNKKLEKRGNLLCYH